MPVHVARILLGSLVKRGAVHSEQALSHNLPSNSRRDVLRV